MSDAKVYSTCRFYKSVFRPTFSYELKISTTNYDQIGINHVVQNFTSQGTSLNNHDPLNLQNSTAHASWTYSSHCLEISNFEQYTGFFDVCPTSVK